MEPFSALDLNIAIEDASKSSALFGATDSNLRLIRAAFDVRIAARDGAIHLSGSPEAVHKAADVFETLQKKLRTARSLTAPDVESAILEAGRDRHTEPAATLEAFVSGVRITPRTAGQRDYISAILNHDLTICLGPAGTGKTYLAVAIASSMLKRKQIDRIVLARPAVEAGEKLGYLPGDLQAKVNPYLRPLFDALHDMMGFEHIRKLMDNDVIEVIPLAFMRGRTLSKSAIILDEAQNTTPAQMLMFLTRLGMQSKIIVTGDDSQSDLAPGQRSGVLDAAKRLAHVPGIAIVRLGRADIVRHALVQSVVEAYGTPSS